MNLLNSFNLLFWFWVTDLDKYKMIVKQNFHNY